MEYSIRNYFSKTRHHDVGPDYKNRAKIFIRDEFQRFGLQTELQVFPDIRVSNKVNQGFNFSYIFHSSSSTPLNPQ